MFSLVTMITVFAAPPYPPHPVGTGIHVWLLDFSGSIPDFPVRRPIGCGTPIGATAHLDLRFALPTAPLWRTVLSARGQIGAANDSQQLLTSGP